MTVRTWHSSVTFTRPFRLKPFTEPHPAGTFDVETDEMSLDINDRLAFRRIDTRITLRQKTSSCTYSIDPADLKAAVARDRGAD